MEKLDMKFSSYDMSFVFDEGKGADEDGKSFAEKGKQKKTVEEIL